jgi:guanyl-specific ribonuclease Sa
MLILQRIKSTFALAFSTILLSSGLASCASHGESNLIPSASKTQSRTLRSISTGTPLGSNTCPVTGSVGTTPTYTCYLAFGGSASINLPTEQISLGDNTCQGSWSPSWWNGSVLTTLSATFSNQSGGGACKSNVSATVTYHDSLPASTPESQSYLAISSPQYDYTWCLMLLHNECAGPSTADGFTTVNIYVDAPPMPAPTPTPILTPTPKPSPTPTPKPSPTPKPTPSPKPSPTPTLAPTPSPKPRQTPNYSNKQIADNDIPNDAAIGATVGSVVGMPEVGAVVGAGVGAVEAVLGAQIIDRAGAPAAGSGTSAATGEAAGANTSVTGTSTGAGTSTVDLQPTYDRINAGQTGLSKNDGGTFSNTQGKLPSQPFGYYKEYVVPTTGISGLGSQRLVIGQDGDTYFTTDHYTTFTPVVPGLPGLGF